MDNSMKSACFEEITHLLCDADKRVNIIDISNNWNVSQKDSETILLEWSRQWIEKNKNKALVKTFFIRGVDKNGNLVISVAVEEKLNVVKEKFDKFSYSLYSVELASKSKGNHVHIEKLSDCKWVNLPLKHVERDIIVKPLPVNQAEEPITAKKIPTIKSEVNDEKTPLENVDIKSEKETPKKKESNKTSKLATGKASITSFFSKQASTSIDVKKEAKSESNESPEQCDSSNMFDHQSSMEVDESKENITNHKAVEHQTKEEVVEKGNNKRSIIDVDDDSNDEIPGTPQETKKPKNSTKKYAEKSSKHTRIMKLEDSSDEEDNRDEQMKLLASPVKEKEESKTTPQNDLVKTTEINLKRKAKKTVSRTFKDEDGYLVTTNEVVEYSCSEEENDLPAEEPIKETKTVPTSDASLEKNAKKKKISPPKAASKQGSILNFFSKK